jgi:uncharacterized membrane protein YphA (DoxX/SURF4 family)
MQKSQHLEPGMESEARQDPRWVDTILDWRWTWLVARIGLTGAYLFGSVVSLFDFPSAAAEQERFGLHPGWFWASLTIAVELIGSILVISGRWVWLGAGMLGVITGVAAIMSEPFWTMTGAARFAATITFLEHFGLIAGLVMAALIAEHENRARRAGVSQSGKP